MKRLFTFGLTVIICSLLCSLDLRAQSEDELTGVLTYMKRAMMFNSALPQEKVYLHFDNTGYFKGETIWFKAYVVRADNSRPTDMSKVVYVELVNPTGDVVETRKMAVTNGVAHGEIKLDSIYGTGFYEVRAYTRYMTNWGNGGIFSRVFPIFEAPAKEGDYSKMIIKDLGYRKRLPNLRSNDLSETNNAAVSHKSYRVRFYPEGGYMVKGLPSRVAFWVTDATGTNLNVMASVLDEDKSVLSDVSTYREGRGVFDITPDGRKKYLSIIDDNGKKHEFLIPEAREEGVTMNLDMLQDEAIFATVCSSPSMDGRLMGYTLIHNGRVIIADTLKCQGAVRIPFDRFSMPGGVSQLTFFTSDGHIQAERQFFICPGPDIEDSIKVTPVTSFPKPCGKIQLDVKARPDANISLSVMDAATMTNGREGNAITWQLLSSDIKGYIEDPGYYFEADDKEHRMAADMLMMVQGWRRYDWALMAEALESNEGYSIFTRETAKFDQPKEDGLYLFGRLKQKSKKYPVDNTWMEATLYNRYGQSLKGTAKTDSLGNYAFSLPDIDGEWNMVLNTGKADKDGYWKDVNYIIAIDRHFSPKTRLLLPNETKTIDLLSANLYNDRKSKQAAMDAQVYVPIQKRENVLPTITVKTRRRIFEGARAAWESEAVGQRYASMYYNADIDADKIADNGELLPSLYEWLARRNPFFLGNITEGNLTTSTAADAAIKADQETSRTASLGDIAGESEGEGGSQASTEAGGSIIDGVDLDAGMFQSTSKHPRVYEDGTGYKNRPVVWILNNQYAQITNLGKVRDFDFFQVLQPCIMDMPILIDEVKSVYISEAPGAYESALLCPDLRGKDPVTVFVYTHHKFNKKFKGTRMTHFQGYNKPETFEMEDYSFLPPMEDFRRTIFWAPDVVTDSTGHAVVEFWNNSSSHEMHVSAEGLTPQGKFLVNE